MRRLVGPLEMHGGEVVLLKDAERGGCLGLVVRIPLARGRGHADGLEAHEHGNPMAERHGAHDAAVCAEALREVRQLRALALGPEPYPVGGQMSLRAALFVYRMVLQELVRLLHEREERLRVPVPAREYGAYLLREVVVRRREDYAGQIRALLHGEVAEARARAHAHARGLRQGREFGVIEEPFDERVALLALYRAGGVRDHGLLREGQALVPAERDHVAAVAGAALGHDAARGRELQRGAAGEVFRRVAAEDAHYGRVAPRREALGYSLHQAQHAAAAEGVEVRLVAGLERGFPAELRQGIVRHAVADDEYIFHRLSSVCYPD